MNKLVPSTVIYALLLVVLLSAGCETVPPYGTEKQLFLPGAKRQVWAIAPALNLSGQHGVDPLLQADLLYQQLQQVHGLTVVPVNRVVEIYAGLKVEKVQSADQAATVCDLLGCDALIVPTVTAYDPYDPPKLGVSLQVFSKPAGFVRPKNIDVYQLSRSPAAREDDDEALPPPDTHFVQAVGIFDAANGTVRDAVKEYARGRNDPVGPLGMREYIVSMDRYCGFVYHALISDLLRQLETQATKKASSAAPAPATIPERKGIARRS